MHDRLTEFRDRVAAPSVGAAVVEPDGVSELAVVGSRSRGGGVAVCASDQWHIGSCGKALTAVLYARLVELDIAEWGVPVLSLFPDLATDVDSAWTLPTIDDLFHCRSGIAANLRPKMMLAAYDEDHALEEQRTAAAAWAMSEPPRRHGRFLYSNLGYIVAGAAIERLTGLAFEDALSAYVLEPLGVDSAGFGPPPDIRGHRPRGQLGSLVVGRGPSVEPSDPRGDNPPLLGPAGRLHLSLMDWARFTRVFLNEGEPLLRRESVDRLLRVPAAGFNGMAMGWAPVRRAEVAFGMQGSNTMWSATALINAEFDRAALVVVNDGRTRVLNASSRFGVDLLASAGSPCQ